MRVSIPVTVTQSDVKRRSAPRSQACPACAQVSSTPVDVAWRVFRLWGMPIRALDVRSRWVCPACGHVSQTEGAPPGLPPLHHRFGGVVIVTVSLGLLAALFSLLWWIGPGYRAKLAQEDAPRESWRARAAAVAERGRRARQECRSAIATARKQAFPSGILAVPRHPPATPSDQLSKLPVDLPDETVRFRVQNPAPCVGDHDPRVFEIENAGPGSFHSETAASVGAKIDAYEALMQKPAPTSFVVVETRFHEKSCDMGVGLVRDGSAAAVEQVTSYASSADTCDLDFALRRAFSAWEQGPPKRRK
jgi:hypothetical protein